MPPIGDALGEPIHCKVRAAPPPEWPGDGPPGAASRTQERVSALWKELLQLDRVGITQNFFELGGNSLLLMRLGAGIEQTFGKKVSAVEIFRYPTIGKLAAFLDSDSGEGDQPDLDGARQRAAARKVRMAARRTPLGTETADPVP